MNKQNLKTTQKPLTKSLCCLLFIISSSLLPLSASENSITITNFVTRNQTIVSQEGKFALGFFTPNNSTSSYLGIWYNTIPNLTIIWVANRSSPIPKGSSPLLKLSEDGNLVVLSGKKIVWTSNVSSVSYNLHLADAILFDNGNLVLRHGEDREVWHSFEHPGDTFVSGMNASSNRRTGEQMRLTSWVDYKNPKPGIFSVGIDPNRYELYIYKGDKPYWRSNVYASSFSYNTGFVKFDQGFAAYFSFIVEDDEVDVVYSMTSNSVKTRFTLLPTGRIQLLLWVKTTWLVLWQQPLATCDFYGFCGSFTICQKDESIPFCRCLTGFHPKSHNEWRSGNWTSGCVRNNTLKCDQGDKFLKFEGMKLPDDAVNTGIKSVNECEIECFKNCSCIAYAYENVTYEVKIVCLNWFRELVDITSNVTIGHDLFVRIHDSELDQRAVDDSQEYNSIRKQKHLITVAVAIVSIGLLLVSVFGCYWRRKRLIRKERIKNELLGFDSVSTASGDASNAELVSFSLRSVLAATGSFSVKNKLGEGGFGPVYRGSLPGNRHVAVKRLSTRSSQGREEFMNELKLIAKLQHNNLVRLLGDCVEKDEKILMYEYMPNRSLDKFLFDPSERVNFDWSTRFKIIDGIAQGLLYLHKYSRLRVIHRDLKASNVLLDQTMTPKISDFGLARIFEMNQIEDKTNRVVGTYGYMAPEYALHGRFSERSDVYSFGVLLLEIVTGKRNTSSDFNEDALTVSEWAWEKWMEGRGVELVDPLIRDTCNPLQAAKCINIGLVCVQEIMNERPTMSEVAVMLSNEAAIVPSPKKPAFTIHKSSQMSSKWSNNEVTITNVDPR